MSAESPDVPAKETHLNVPVQVFDLLVDLARKNGPNVAPSLIAKEDSGTKPGYKTTEFYICVAMMVAGIVMNFVPEQSMVGHIIGGLMSVASAFGYTAARVAIKNGPGEEE